MYLENWHIHDNTFLNIRGATGGGRAAVFLWQSSINCLVERNVFVGCDRAVAFGNPSGPREDNHMDGGIIRNNFIVAGAGKSVELCYTTGNIRVYNNTIYNRAATSTMAYRFTISLERNMTAPKISNNIIMGNINTVSGTAPATSNNLDNNVSASWFRSVLNGDLHLTSAAASAMDGGAALSDVTTDFDDCARSNPPDIGADEFGQDQCAVSAFMNPANLGSGQNRLVTYPNPFSTSVFFEIRTANSELRDMQLTIYDIHGKLVQQLDNRGSHSAFRSSGYTWDASGHPNGIYIVRFVNGKKQLTSSVILDK
jgi:hypothetical protein